MRPPLPASAVEYWHSELGVALIGGEVDTWTGQLRGLALQAISASQRPTYAADGANFKARLVVQSNAAATRGLTLNPVAPPLTVAGSKPHAYLITRYRTLPAGGNAFFYISVDTLPTAAAIPFGSLGVNTAGGLFSWWYPRTGTPVLSGTTLSTAVARLESLLDATNTDIVRLNGAQIYAGSATATTSDATAMCVGHDRGGATSFLDASFAFFLLCASAMTAPELAALNAWAQAYWGTP